MPRGTVASFNLQKGYGYIQPLGSGCRDVFVHISAVEKAGLSSLNEGELVEYEEIVNRGGRNVCRKAEGSALTPTLATRIAGKLLGWGQTPLNGCWCGPKNDCGTFSA